MSTAQQQETTPIDRVGNFRGKIIEYHGVEGNGGSVSISIKALITGEWDDENQAWADTWPSSDGSAYPIEAYNLSAEGIVCVVKKDRTINETGAKSLVDCAGWDGSMMSIWSQSWKPTPVAFKVEENEYKGKKTLRITWLNPYDSTPGGRGNMDEQKAKVFDSTYGAQLRALASNSSRNSPAAAPTGKPPAPKGPGAPRRPRTPNAKAAAAEAQNGDPSQGETIPF